MLDGIVNNLKGSVLALSTALLVISPVLPEPLWGGDVSAKDSSAPSDRLRPPKLTVPSATHDFGDVQPGQKVSFSFELYNVGAGDLVILRQKTTCGCTIADPVRGSIAPQTSRKLNVTFTAGKRPGWTEKKIILETNDPAQPLTILTITASIKPPVEGPDQGPDGRAAQAGDARSNKAAFVQNITRAATAINDILGFPGALPGRVLRKVGTALLLTSSFYPYFPIDIAQHFRLFAAETRTRTEEPPANAPAGRLLADPKGIFFGTVEPNERATKTVAILLPSFYAGHKLSVVAKGQASTHIQTAILPGEDNRHTLKVTWTPEKGSKNVLCKLNVIVKRQDTVVEKLEIPCYGLVGR